MFDAMKTKKYFQVRRRYKRLCVRARVFFNLLPFICESSIWRNMFRVEQNQSLEFDYAEPINN